MIATVAGSALVQYRKGEGRPPLAAAGLLAMGGLYTYIGSVLYVYQTLLLRRTLGLGAFTVLWAAINAVWPVVLWTISLACILDETPNWLLHSLCAVESLMPAALHSSFFIETRQLQPILRLLHSIQEHEARRLCTMQPQGLPLSQMHGIVLRRQQTSTAVFTNAEYSNIISTRLERLQIIESKLARIADTQSKWVLTSTSIPLLDRLYSSISQLEIALEAEIHMAQMEEKSFFGWMKSQVSWSLLVERRMLEDEFEAVQALKRRCVAVKTDAVFIE